MASKHFSSLNHVQQQQWHDWVSPGQWAKLQTKFFEEICQRHGIQFGMESLSLPSHPVYSNFLQQQSAIRSLVDIVARAIPAGSSVDFSLEFANRTGVRNLANDRIVFDSEFPFAHQQFITVRLSVTHPIVDNYLTQKGHTFDLTRSLTKESKFEELVELGPMFSCRTTGKRSKLALSIPCWTLDSWLNQALVQFPDRQFISMNLRSDRLQEDRYVTEIDRTVQLSAGADMLIRVANLDYWLIPDRDFDLRWIRQNLLMTTVTSRTDLTKGDFEINCQQCGTVSELIERLKDEQAREGDLVLPHQSQPMTPVSDAAATLTDQQENNRVVASVSDRPENSKSIRIDAAQPLLFEHRRLKFRVLRDVTKSTAGQKSA